MVNIGAPSHARSQFTSIDTHNYSPVKHERRKFTNQEDIILL